MGSLELKGGFCDGLHVKSLESTDLSQDLVLEYALALRGVGIHCVIEGESSGSLDLEVTVADSSLNASVQVLPFTAPEFPNLPMPFGGLNLTGCDVDIKVSSFKFNGTSSLVTIMESFGEDMLISLMGTFINDPLCEGMKGLLATNGTSAVRQAAELSLPLLAPPPALPEPQALVPLMDWTEYPPIRVMNALLTERFSLWSDRIVEILQVSTLDVSLLKTNNVSMTLRTLHLEGLVDKKKPGLSLTGAKQDVNLFANFTGLTLKSTLVLQVYLPDQPPLTELIEVTVGLDNFTLGVRAFLDRSTLQSMEVDDIMNSPKCLIEATEGTTNPRNQSVAIEELALSLRPLLNVAAYGGLLERDAVRLINTLISSLFKGYMPTVQALTNGGLGLARETLNTNLWSRFAQHEPCSREQLLLGVSMEAILAAYWGAPALALLGALLGGLAQWRWGVGRARAREVEHAEASCEEHCLAMEPFVPWFLKVFFPFALLSVWVLFIYADLDLGATVNVVMSAGGQSSMVGPVFAFSLLGTVVHAWSSGAFVISVLAFLASGLWPFTKLVLLAVTWLMPPSMLSRRVRGRILYFLDVFGKYSFLDSWFLVLTLNAFALSWQSVGDAGDAMMMVQTSPLKAFYCFFLATALSLVLGHIASEAHVHAAHSHHRLTTASEPAALAAAELLGDEEETPTVVDGPAPAPAAAAGDVAAAVAAGSPPPGADTERRSESSAGSSEETSEASHGEAKVPVPAAEALCAFASSPLKRVALTSSLAVTLVLLVVSVSVTSFDFWIGGIFTEFVFGDEVHKEYSLTSVGASVSAAGRGEPGLVVLEVAYIFLAVVLPIATLLAIIALWVVPMHLRTQEVLVRLCYIADSWASFDVAVVVLIIGVMQFGRLSEFLVHKSDLAMPCTKIQDLTQSECMRITMDARPQVAVLVCAFLLVTLVPKVALRMSATSIFRRFCAIKAASRPSNAGDAPREVQADVQCVAVKV